MWLKHAESKKETERWVAEFLATLDVMQKGLAEDVITQHKAKNVFRSGDCPVKTTNRAG